MESRKMVQMNYFQGNNGDTDIEKRLMGKGGREGKIMERVAQKHIHCCC